ncbi:MAG TPA: hypothetical protein VFB23_14065 [Candidatus Acidoferrales bacterium]|jgi:hypothetical protein|nr:hypothetical protein [Candidatus Acidoferrales bacterium]
MRIRTIALLTLFVLAIGPAVHAANEKTLPLRTDVTLNGQKLTAGFYEISWISHSPEATVTFIRAGRVTVTAMGKWLDRGVKSPGDAFVYTNNPDGSHTLLEIRFAGKRQALVFAPTN